MVISIEEIAVNAAHTPIKYGKSLIEPKTDPLPGLRLIINKAIKQ